MLKHERIHSHKIQTKVLCLRLRCKRTWITKKELIQIEDQD
jgi:hypothetical protein